MPSRLWARWKRFAHRAAEVQSYAILALLYWVVVVPAGFVRNLTHRNTSAPAWKTRTEAAAPSIDDARRQY